VCKYVQRASPAYMRMAVTRCHEQQRWPQCRDGARHGRVIPLEALGPPPSPAADRAGSAGPSAGAPRAPRGRRRGTCPTRPCRTCARCQPVQQASGLLVILHGAVAQISSGLLQLCSPDCTAHSNTASSGYSRPLATSRTQRHSRRAPASKPLPHHNPSACSGSTTPSSCRPRTATAPSG